MKYLKLEVVVDTPGIGTSLVNCFGGGPAAIELRVVV